MKLFTEVGQRPQDDYSPLWVGYNAAHPELRRSIGADIVAPAPEIEPGSDNGDGAAAEGTSASTAFYQGGEEQDGEDMILRDRAEPEGEGDDEDEASDAEAAAAAPNGKEKVPLWMQRRLNKERAKRGEAERGRQAAENTVRAILSRAVPPAAAPAAEGDAPVAAPAAPAPQSRVPSREEYLADVQRTAHSMAAMENFNAKCNDVASKGSKEFEDFNTRASEMQQLYDPNDAGEAARFHGLLEGVIEAGGADAHKLYYEIAGNMNLASELMELSPFQLGTRLAKMAAPKGAAAPSGAPRPVRVVKGSGDFVAATPSDPNRSDRLSTADWMEKRSKEAEAARGSRHRGR